ncbi:MULTISPECIES: SDR family oxidoreductase [unclassified Mesorhizobium]|uniref:SDR family oxidoreductase n=1 Tax=unclassified Mesorhizobium TaxID=325217 RepID=UPI003338F817
MSFTARPLEQSVAVVTGGTQGVGEQIARLLAERQIAGCLITGRQPERGAAVAAALAAKGCRASFVQADLAEVEAASRIMEAADKAFGRVDILVNAAGDTSRGTILDTSPETFDRLFAVNVRAPFFLIQKAVEIMRREKANGSILNLVSMSGHGGQSFIAPYCASKGALATLTRNVAFSLLPDRIRVNGLNIGWTDSPGERAMMASVIGPGSEKFLAEAGTKLPFGRLLDPVEIARAAVFLVSPESGIMTGSLVDYDQSILGCSDSGPQPAARVPDHTAA